MAQHNDLPSYLAVLLPPINTEHQPSITMRLIVTISGNTPSTVPNALSIPSAESTNRVLPAEILPATPDHAAQITSNAHPDLQAIAEAEAAKASEDLSKVNPQLHQLMAELPANGASVATPAATGLVSIMSKLDGLIQIANLLADVSTGYGLIILTHIQVIDPTVSIRSTL